MLSEPGAGDAVDVVCWVIGEPTFGTDQYGSMWLLTTGARLRPLVPRHAGRRPRMRRCRLRAADADRRAPLPLPPDLNVEGPVGVFYDDCHEAVAMGTAPVYRNENGYREDLDSDADGIRREWVPEDS